MTFGERAISHDIEPAARGRDSAPHDDESPGPPMVAGIAGTSSSGALADVPSLGPAASEHAARRDTDLQLARLHLRLGALTLARAELEAANGDLPLTGGSLLDLADARWRTGDLAGAGSAAQASLLEASSSASSRPASRRPASSRPDGSRVADTSRLLSTVIAAEAALADGRAVDANDLANMALELAGPEQGEALETVFAGMPRSALWPGDPFEAALAGGSHAGNPATRPGGSAGLGGMTRTRLETPRPAPPTTFARAGASGQRANSDPVAELAAAEEDLESGDVTSAAIRLGVVVRLAPALAPAVLELLEGSAGRLAALIRGDAYRVVGREDEAEQAYAEATRAIAPEASHAIAPDATDASVESPRQAILEDPP